jgi:hypothetical protein
MKNAVYDPAAINELYLFANNSREIYTRYLEPIENCLIKKAKKGVFDASKAPAAYKTALREAAKLYCKIFGGDFRKVFPVAVREAVADIFVFDFLDEKDYLID